jgi:uncharacterized protein (TIGR02118 family)
MGRRDTPCIPLSRDYGRRMIRLSVYYNPPADPEAFVTHYESTHVPLASKMPGLRSYVWGKSLATPTGDPAPYFVTAELTFDDMEALGTAASSPEGAAALADMANFADAGAVTVISESIVAV